MNHGAQQTANTSITCTVLQIGAVQGLAQFLCQLTKGVSGVVGDVLGSQVRVLVFGTFLTLACKPMFALLSSVYGVFGVTATIYWFFCAKLLDRMSKGIREAPTKAVMNELAKESGDSPDAAYGKAQNVTAHQVQHVAARQLEHWHACMSSAGHAANSCTQLAAW